MKCAGSELLSVCPSHQGIAWGTIVCSIELTSTKSLYVERRLLMGTETGRWRRDVKGRAIAQPHHLTSSTEHIAFDTPYSVRAVQKN